MASLTIRNLPDDVHRALRVRAARNGNSTEAEVRAILKQTVKPESRVKLGSLLAEIGRKVKLTDEEIALIEQVRDKSPARHVSFE
ncbi:MAG: plasmid stabilization protein [Gammaproteobacteria bacterium]|nr:plasmid stabilization protein [Gammaproteobacteria bacterium]MDE0154214.1 plasmid stabilization protein [Gammaproteobacteria bacterium]MDE0283739.1 plasmid stabilization protein [Gammaproteobacteria bacterium]